MSTMEVTAEEYYSMVADENYEKGVTQGISKGVDNICKLNSWLYSLGRDADVKRATEDPEFLAQLFKEYEASFIKK